MKESKGTCNMGYRQQSTTTANPPFDFAQGRLFGDDN
jgi:hypothetical protein